MKRRQRNKAVFYFSSSAQPLKINQPHQEIINLHQLSLTNFLQPAERKLSIFQ